MTCAAPIAGTATVSPPLGCFLRELDNALNDAARVAFQPYFCQAGLYTPYNTASTTDREDARTWSILSWLCCVQTPAWLTIAGLTDFATSLAAQSITDGPTAAVVYDTLSLARVAAVDARNDTWAAHAADRAGRFAADRAAGLILEADATWSLALPSTNDDVWDACWNAARATSADSAWCADWLDDPAAVLAVVSTLHTSARALIVTLRPLT